MSYIGSLRPWRVFRLLWVWNLEWSTSFRIGIHTWRLYLLTLLDMLNFGILKLKGAHFTSFHWINFSLEKLVTFILFYTHPFFFSVNKNPLRRWCMCKGMSSWKMEELWVGRDKVIQNFPSGKKHLENLQPSWGYVLRSDHPFSQQFHQNHPL